MTAQPSLTGEVSEHASPDSLPSRLAALGPRQQEIATIVYASCAATPRDVQGRLSEPRSIRVVRTLLDRMVAKGMLRRRQSGRDSATVYVPAIVTPRLKATALERLVRDRFDGSLEEAAAAIAELAERESQVPRNLIAVRRRFEQTHPIHAMPTPPARIPKSRDATH